MHPRIAHIMRPVRTPGAKSTPRQLYEMASWGARLITTPNDYRTYGLYMRGRTRDDAMRYLSVTRAKELLWPLNSETDHLHNKLLFEAHFSSRGLPVPQTVVVIGNPEPSGSPGVSSADPDAALRLLIENVRSGRQLVVKPIDGWGGVGVMVLRDVAGDDFILSNGDRLPASELLGRIREGAWLVQDRIVQHPYLAELNESSLNTLRLGTFLRKNGDVEIVFAKLRVGRAHNQVDSNHAGGYSVWIDQTTGRFSDQAFQLADHSLTPSFRHPDSGIPYSGRVYPMWEEVISTSTAFARAAGANRFVGWDVALSPEGPVFVEGNRSWDVQLSQIGSAGMLTDGFIDMLRTETGEQISADHPPPLRPLRALLELRRQRS